MILFIWRTANNSHKFVFKFTLKCGKCRSWSWDAEVKSFRWLCHAAFPVGRNWRHHNRERYANVKDASFPLRNRQVIPIAEQIYLGCWELIGAIDAISWVLTKPPQWKDQSPKKERDPLWFRLVPIQSDPPERGQLHRSKVFPPGDSSWQSTRKWAALA